MLKGNSDNANFNGLKSTPLNSVFKSNVTQKQMYSKSNNENRLRNQDKLDLNTDDDSDNENLFDCAQKYKTEKSEVVSLTLNDYISNQIPSNSSDIKSTPLSGGCLSDLSSLLKELDQIQSGAPLRASSRLSMVLLDDDDDKPLKKREPVSSKLNGAPMTKELSRGKTIRSKPLIDLSKPSQPVVKPIKKNEESSNSTLDDIQAKIDLAKTKLENVNIKKITTKIYLMNEEKSRTVQLTSLSTPDLIIQGFIEAGLLEGQKEWLLIEKNEGFGVERSMKGWESIMDVIEAWEEESNNALLIRIKENEQITTLVPLESPIKGGWVQVEVKRGKWERKYLILKNGSLYLSKSESAAASILLCSLEKFDSYLLTRKRNKQATSYLFALKSLASILYFENPEEDYIHFMAVDSKESLESWILALRYARSWYLLNQFLIKPSPFSPFLNENILDRNNSIFGIELDKGQFSDLGIVKKSKASGKSDYLTSDTAGGIAKRLFRLVLTGDQGKTDIDKVIGAKELPNVFVEGSLLSNPRTKKEPEEDKDVEDEREVFREGSLLSNKASVSGKNNQGGTLLNGVNNAQALNRSFKPQPISTNTNKDGPLLKVNAKDNGLFQNGSLLNKPTSPISPNNLTRKGTLLNRQAFGGHNNNKEKATPSLMSRSISNPPSNHSDTPVTLSPLSESSDSNNLLLEGISDVKKQSTGPLINCNDKKSNSLPENQGGLLAQHYENKIAPKKGYAQYNKGSLMDQHFNPTNSSIQPNIRPTGYLNSQRSPTDDNITNNSNQSRIGRTQSHRNREYPQSKPNEKEKGIEFAQGTLLSRAKTISKPKEKLQFEPQVGKTLIQGAGFKKTTVTQGPLLKLDLSREQDHSQQIRKKKMEPLISFK